MFVRLIGGLNVGLVFLFPRQEQQEGLRGYDTPQD
jgi:hypothetical protein